MKHLWLIWRGLGTLPEYGEHPGIAACVFLIAVTMLAGAIRAAWAGLVFGLAVGCIIYLPLLAYGAWDRARECEKRGLLRD